MLFHSKQSWNFKHMTLLIGAEGLRSFLHSSSLCEQLLMQTAGGLGLAWGHGAAFGQRLF